MPTSKVYEASLKHFLSPIWSLMEDESVSEVMVNGNRNVYCESEGQIFLTDLAFPDEAALLAAVRNIAEYVDRPLGGSFHSMDARLPLRNQGQEGGERVHVIIPPASRNGICLTIRKFGKSIFNLDSLVEKESLSFTAAEFLDIAVKLHKNTVISGGTGTGKTSMLNALSTAISERERIVVIEDSSELQLKQAHTIYLEAQSANQDGEGEVTIRDLFVDSLRMRPDRIVVGEVRRGEALDLIQSMISGHAGSLTTVHASTAADAAVRLETLCLMSDAGLPVHVARTQVASAIHLVVQLARLNDGSRRVSSISESIGLDEQNRYLWNPLFQFRSQGIDEDGKIVGELVPTGRRPSFASEAYDLGFGDQIELTRDLFSSESPPQAICTQ